MLLVFFDVLGVDQKYLMWALSCDSYDTLTNLFDASCPMGSLSTNIFQTNAYASAYQWFSLQDIKKSIQILFSGAMKCANKVPIDNLLTH